MLALPILLIVIVLLILPILGMSNRHTQGMKELRAGRTVDGIKLDEVLAIRPEIN
jgi:hypothetical protein